MFQQFGRGSRFSGCEGGIEDPEWGWGVGECRFTRGVDQKDQEESMVSKINNCRGGEDQEERYREESKNKNEILEEG